MTFKLELDKKAFHKNMADVGENIDRILREWVFIGLTYDPVSGKTYTFMDDKYVEMSYGETLNIAPNRPLSFTGNAPYFVDNVFYFPKYSTADKINAIYQLSKYITIR